MLAWTSPSLPIGAFAYSHGLEQLFEAGRPDWHGTQDAVSAALHAGGRSDAILLAHAFRATAARDSAGFEALRALAFALATSAERQAETVGQGNAFAAIVDAVWPDPRGHFARLGGGGDLALPLAVGAAAAMHAVPLPLILHAHLAGFAASLVSAAVRLIPLGQTDGQRITAGLGGTVAALAREAAAAGLDDLGSAALGLDIAAMRHETLEWRIFRS